VSRWLLGEEFAAIRVIAAKPNRHGGDLQDPLLMILETESGVLVNVETSVNIKYGYDIRGEVVGETGVAALAESNPVVLKLEGSFGGRVPADWRERFVRAFDLEFQEWINATVSGTATGPSSGDGYAATVVADAALEALRTGTRTTVSMRERPDFYTGKAGL